MGRHITICPILVNRSEFAINNAKLEIRTEAPDGISIGMMRSDHLPYEPEPWGYTRFVNSPSTVDRLKENVYVDDRGGQPIGHVLLGTIRPGEEARCEQDIVLADSTSIRNTIGCEAAQAT